ncbi:MAG: hypothetical protein GXO75_17960 [Calditrichaeota bacterium]|nr:hypothetical protein [Calditrichota bacterium]
MFYLQNTGKNKIREIKYFSNKNCNYLSLPDTFAICPYCGAGLKEKCPSCGKSVKADWRVRPYCGTKLKK